MEAEYWCFGREAGFVPLIAGFHFAVFGLLNRQQP
jgi:hypothetical protein